VFDLLPFSLQETPRVSWLRGGYPEVVLRPRAANDWFRSYVRTYLERDVRAVTEIRDLAVFRRFLALVATRVGQTVNRSDFAAPLGVSVPTITQWLSILEITGQVLLIPPFHQNFGKRLTKSPKLYLSDSGLACHLLGITTERELLRSPFAGPIFEGFVASELAKLQLHAGRSRALYFFRDHQGLEVDFVVPLGGARIALVEAKASRTVWPRDAAGIKRVAALAGDGDAEGYVVHRAAPGDEAGSALAPGVKALGLRDLLQTLARRP
jgi:predicted AAA+ superfamily ATPase